MGFQKGFYVPKSEEIIDNAFKLAKKEASGVQESDKNRLIIAKEKKRIKVAAEYVANVYEGVIKKFPSLGSLNPFYSAMIENEMDIVPLKKALGHANSATKMIYKLKNEYLIKIRHRQKELAGKTRTEFYGRLKSVVKRTKKSMDKIVEGYKLISKIPKVKEMPTVVLIGLPNVGKSTLLKNITGSNVEIKDYPFTTKKLQLGYLEHKYLKFQLIDSPGLLDRPEKKQNTIEKQTVIALEKISTSALFVLDPTQEAKLQKNLVKRYLKDKEKTIFVITKLDKVEADELDEFKIDIFKELKIDNNIFELRQDRLEDRELEIIESIKNEIYKENKVHYIR